MKDQGKSTPAWASILFFVVLIAGVGYGLLFGAGKNRYETLHDSMHKPFEVATVTVVPDRTPAAIAAGQSNYMAACLACHGANREGIVGPSLADTEWLHADKEEDLVRLIAKGIPAGQTKTGKGPMPAKGIRPDLTGEQVWEIVYFLSSKNPSIKKFEK